MHRNRFFAISLALIAALPSAAGAETLDPANVNAFDRALMFPYSRGLDIASEVTQYASFLMPAVFLLAAEKEDYPEIGLMYAGTAALALGGRFGLKAMAERDRPYMYFDNPPPGEVASGDSRKSFPSGHTLIAFSGAAFTATMFALRYPDSRYRVPATAMAFALAGSTAAMRVASGNHFASDVLVGACVGSAIGFLVPFVATKLGSFGEGGKNHVFASPLGFTFIREL